MVIETAQQEDSAAASEAAAGVFHPDMPLAEIVPSETNPRKTFNDAELQELAVSIKEKGVIQPIVVRPNSQWKTAAAAACRWEIVAGERRWRASKIAGLTTILAIARDLGDKAVLEIQIVENLQRAEVHPIEESRGYAQLIQTHGYEPEAVAAKIGRSVSYVYQRLKLKELVREAQDLFLGGIINAGHAILIARLTPDEQREVISDENGLLWVDGWRDAEHPQACSVRDLTIEIRRSLYLDLAKAPWKLNDTKLVSAAGACLKCPKRTGANRGLFDDIEEKDICTDRACYNLKMEAFLARPLNKGGLVHISMEHQAKKDSTDAGALRPDDYHVIWRRDDADPEDDDERTCPSMRKAVISVGHGRGQTRDICANKDCPVHGKYLNDSTATSGRDSFQEKQRAQERKLKIEVERRTRIFKAVMTKAPKALVRADLELIAENFWKRRENDSKKLLLKIGKFFEPGKQQYGQDLDGPAAKYIKAASDAELAKFLLAVALGAELQVYSFNSDTNCKALAAAAERLKIDHAKITADVKAEFKAKSKKKQLQTSAKGKSAGSTADVDEDSED